MEQVKDAVLSARNTTAKPVLGSPPDGHQHLSAAILLQQYGVNGSLDADGLQQAFAAIVSCQVKHFTASMHLSDCTAASCPA